MRLHAAADPTANDFRLLNESGAIVGRVRWLDTDAGEYGVLRPRGGEIVFRGAPFTVIRWPTGEKVAAFSGSGSSPGQAMRMHVEDEDCDDSLRVRDPEGNPIWGVRWFDTETEQVGKLPTDTEGRVQLPDVLPDGEALPEEVLNTPFRVVDGWDGEVVISSRSLQ